MSDEPRRGRQGIQGIQGVEGVEGPAGGKPGPPGKAGKSAPRVTWRDLWMVIVTGIVLYALATGQNLASSTRTNQMSNTRALCSLRADVQSRVTSAEALLQAHPDGIASISAATIKASNSNSERTVQALKPLTCPK